MQKRIKIKLTTSERHTAEDFVAFYKVTVGSGENETKLAQIYYQRKISRFVLDLSAMTKVPRGRW